jgi:hypothetical protein
MAPAEASYHPKDAVSAGIKGTAVVGGAGLFAAAVQNTLTKRNTTAFGVFTRFGGTFATFGTFNCVEHCHIYTLIPFSCRRRHL